MASVHRQRKTHTRTTTRLMRMRRARRFCVNLAECERCDVNDTTALRMTTTPDAKLAANTHTHANSTYNIHTHTPHTCALNICTQRQFECCLRLARMCLTNVGAGELDDNVAVSASSQNILLKHSQFDFREFPKYPFTAEPIRFY